MDKTNGLGKPCESDTDCAAPLLCRFDPTDYIAHKQCAYPCAAESDCTSKFGEYSMCIGANICVTKCIVQSDCPAKTQCITSDWCERTGPGSGVPYCTGSALPCGGRTETECFASLGCNENFGTCSGIVESCFSQFSSYGCYSILGCSWDSSTQSCYGSAESCDLMAGEATCGLQPGCSWAPGSCSGTPEACDQVPAALCSESPGCTLAQ